MFQTSLNLEYLYLVLIRAIFLRSMYIVQICPCLLNDTVLCLVLFYSIQLYFYTNCIYLYACKLVFIMLVFQNSPQHFYLCRNCNSVSLDNYSHDLNILHLFQCINNLYNTKIYYNAHMSIHDY